MDSRKVAVTVAVLLTVVVAVLVPTTATAEGCSAGVKAGNTFVASGHCNQPAHSSPGEATSTSQSTAVPAEIWVWRPICEKHSDSVTTGQGLCSRAASCPQGKILMRRWRLKPLPHITTTIACMPESAANQPVITPGLVLRAFRRIPLPTAHTIVQPRDKTLVNLATIFHTDVAPLVRTINLLGQRVRLSIRPSTFTWTYGDGSTATTHTPGAPYPSKAIVHHYLHAHVTVHPTVQVTWSATYTVNGGPSRPVPGTVTTSGAAATLRIKEAIPSLSGYGH